MEIIKKIIDLKESIEETEIMVQKLISNLDNQRNKTNNKQKKILLLKEEVEININKIDEIIEDYNANS